MITSIWRYSHLSLAVSSFLFLTLASLTGIVLAFEPVIQKTQPFKAAGFDTITLAQSLPALREKLKGLQTLTVDNNDFVTAKFSDEKGNDQTAYIHPLTGAILGQPQKQSPIFEWTTSLHRSLFLHETGRWIVGITAFLLMLIALSGIGLVIQRQKSIRQFFAPVEKASFAQYYHVVFGRIILFFILALALSGTYLSVNRFFIKPQKISLQVNEDAIKEEPEKKPEGFAIFQQTRLSQVASIEFPFSEFPEDYYTLKLHDREVCINQITGDILAQQLYPKAATLAAFSLRWHTGRSNAVWAILMAVTAAYILFFIYSGFAITWKRIRNKLKNKHKASDSRIIILVGSENGSTYAFAAAVYKQLIKHGEKVFITELNKYTLFPKAEHLLVMTSTYGAGDPPSNAKKFEKLVTNHPQQQPFAFSVVGFGSRSYKHYCQFAYHADHVLRQQKGLHPLLEVATVNEQSPQDFSNWLTTWMKATGFPLLMPRKLLKSARRKLHRLKVLSKTQPDTSGTFLLSLKSKRSRKVVSGDLLAIYPKNDHRERLYSIGIVNGAIQLSVKLHEHGIGSQFLHALVAGTKTEARIIKNEHFHFPKQAATVVLISNGTGIAPFLGMIDGNRKKLPVQLYCGFRTQADFSLYQPLLQAGVTAGKLEKLHLALSREGHKQYVHHLLQEDKSFLHQTLINGGIIMLCGSLTMQKDVLATLEAICQEYHLENVESYQEKGQIRLDCY